MMRSADVTGDVRVAETNGLSVAVHQLRAVESMYGELKQRQIATEFGSNKLN